MNTLNYIDFYLKFDNNINIDPKKFCQILCKTKNINIDNKKLGNAFQKTIYEEFFEEFTHFQMFDSYDSFNSNKKAIKESIIIMNPLEFDNIKILPLESIIKNDNVLTMMYNKEDLPLSIFPSTSKCYEKHLEQRISFKIFNRLYLNFSTKQYASEPNDQYHYIYFNYHYGDKLDVNEHAKSISEIISKIQE